MYKIYETLQLNYIRWVQALCDRGLIYPNWLGTLFWFPIRAAVTNWLGYRLPGYWLPL